MESKDFYYLEIVIPGIPDSLNRTLRQHYKARNKTNKHWYDLVKTMVGRQAPRVPLKKAHIKIVRRYYRFLDWDGAVGSMKPILDGLVQARIIKDDTYKVTGPWDVTQEFLPKKDGGHVYLLISESLNKD